jgi:aminoglycoside phosphotransferase (APT) family kinase protein
MVQPVNYLDWTIAQLADRLWDVAMAYNDAENDAAMHDRFNDHLRANAAADSGAAYLDEANAIKAELERRSKHLGLPDVRLQVCPMCGYDPAASGR